jgi:hypothetical protein
MPTVHPNPVPRAAAVLGRSLLAAAALTMAASLLPAQSLPPANPNDPRARLRAGWWDAAQAARNMELAATVRPREGFYDPQRPGSFAYANSDLAFRGTLVFQGSFHGIQVWDVADPRAPRLVSTFACPGGQGDVSIHGDLLFMSVEETRGRVDCGAQGVQDTVSAERFRGVRIFDVSDLQDFKVVTQVQTCRGSHTHTLVTDPRDRKNLYVYVSGTSVVRSENELAGCSRRGPDDDPNTSLFRIEVIRVPLDAPQEARVVSTPRIFADAEGRIAGLWPGGAHGEGTQRTATTNQCHDITAYPEIGLAAGACSGNGILLDIRDPVNPKRVAEVLDPNFAYWHSATFNNDASTVLFTDEWGGGTSPRCRATDNPLWGANAYFTRSGNALTPAGFYKLPAAQTATENCVAHNGSLIPVPGRDIFVQAWYQGGVSVTDFTDPMAPREIAYFDRGPVDSTRLVLAGSWSAYWYNGMIYSSEIARGLDVLELVPSGELTQNEIDAARSVRWDVFNPQEQKRIVWPDNFAVARAYHDQLWRFGGLAAGRLDAVRSALDAAEAASGRERRQLLERLGRDLDRDARTAADGKRVRALSATVKGIAKATR